MTHSISGTTLTRLAQLLIEPRSQYRSRSDLSRFEQTLLNEGVASNFSIGENLSITERRNAGAIERFFEELFGPLGIPQQVIWRRPERPEDDLEGEVGLNAVDATGLLIRLQSIGVQVDPTRLVRALAPSLEEKRSMTRGELEVALYDSLLGRQRTVLTATEASTGTPERVTQHVDEAGYRFTIEWMRETVVRLEVRGPQYVEEEKRECVRCDFCGCMYETHNAADARVHEKLHNLKVQLHEPAPNSALACRLVEFGSSGERVTHDEPLWMHGEVYSRAAEFRREMRFDFVQWDGSSTKPAGEDWEGWLFAADRLGTIAGACAFMKVETAEGKAGWSLQWAWIAPRYRRTGLLTARWPAFLEAYGDFEVEPPYSDAMALFLQKHGTVAQKAWLPQQQRGE
ncbi:hypothetical protein [Pseudomonas aeruginosa]|uniref:hypothetical protein n=1 Tax=Pseudomonas aeruginosa TaxID=287 RepID=UPI0029BFDBD2|nr:hypothetical protein [Pseudomonas aeruginosa]